MAEALTRHHYLGHDASLVLGQIVESGEAGLPRDSLDDFLLRRLLRYGLVRASQDDPPLVVASAAGVARWRYEAVALGQRRREQERRDVIRRRLRARMDRMDAAMAPMPMPMLPTLPGHWQPPDHRQLAIDEQRKLLERRDTAQQRSTALTDQRPQRARTTVPARVAAPEPPSALPIMLQELFDAEPETTAPDSLDDADVSAATEEPGSSQWWQRLFVALVILGAVGAVPVWWTTAEMDRPAKVPVADGRLAAAPMPAVMPATKPPPAEKTPVEKAALDKQTMQAAPAITSPAPMIAPAAVPVTRAAAIAPAANSAQPKMEQAAEVTSPPPTQTVAPTRGPAEPAAPVAKKVNQIEQADGPIERATASAAPGSSVPRPIQAATPVAPSAPAPEVVSPPMAIAASAAPQPEAAAPQADKPTTKPTVAPPVTETVAPRVHEPPAAASSPVEQTAAAPPQAVDTADAVPAARDAPVVAPAATQQAATLQSAAIPASALQTTVQPAVVQAVPLQPAAVTAPTPAPSAQASLPPSKAVAETPAKAPAPAATTVAVETPKPTVVADAASAPMPIAGVTPNQAAEAPAQPAPPSADSTNLNQAIAEAMAQPAAMREFTDAPAAQPASFHTLAPRRTTVAAAHAAKPAAPEPTVDHELVERLNVLSLQAAQHGHSFTPPTNIH